MSVTQEQVDKIASPMIRKYDWHTTTVEDGVKLTVTDGLEEASVDITTGEDIVQEINRLIDAVDAHNYTIIG